MTLRKKNKRDLGRRGSALTQKELRKQGGEAKGGGTKKNSRDAEEVVRDRGLPGEPRRKKAVNTSILREKTLKRVGYEFAQAAWWRENAQEKVHFTYQINRGKGRYKG